MGSRSPGNARLKFKTAGLPWGTVYIYNGKSAVVEAPVAGLPRNNGKSAVVEAPPAGLLRNNGRNAVVEEPRAG
ncbi:hypothetical protein [Paenibacillus sonchi]|uniref:hypothetical protein n=1 Tax=Paenibacillus sonchi TaxID=373687 RepID=UPI001F218557|nr:hypothetical protein [Paenibacillus sonchi]